MSSRCELCKKKLGIIEYKCKCLKKFCIKHLQAEFHDCKYDYKAELQSYLKKQCDIVSEIKKEQFERL